MSKLSELAARSAEIRKDIDARADKLAERLAAIPDMAETVFTKHDETLAEIESGITDLEDSLRDLAGHNSPLSKSTKSS